VEAHGTGTSAGDSIEIRALATVLGEGRALDRPCHIGSVKTNIGHTEGAAGMASLIKAVLCLKHRALPKSLHCENPNPALPWSELPLVIQQTLEPLAAQKVATGVKTNIAVIRLCLAARTRQIRAKLVGRVPTLCISRAAYNENRAKHQIEALEPIREPTFGLALEPLQNSFRISSK
jgi:hypothetical protein